MLKNTEELFEYLVGKIPEVGAALEKYKIKIGFTDVKAGSFCGRFANDDGLSLDIVGIRFKDECSEEVYLQFRYFSLKWHKGFTYIASDLFNEKECQDFRFLFPTSKDKVVRAVKNLLFLKNFLYIYLEK